MFASSEFAVNPIRLPDLMGGHAPPGSRAGDAPEEYKPVRDISPG